MLANITSVENLVRQLKDLEKTITEVQTTNKIVSILPSQFQHFRVVWDAYKESEQTMELLTLRLLAEERRMDAAKREIQEPSPSKPVEALAVTNQHRRGNYRGGRFNSNNRWQSQTQPNNWKKRANVFCDFHNISTHSSEECRNHPKNKRQKSDQHAKVSVLKSEEEEKDDHSFHIMEDSMKTIEENDTGMLTLVLHVTCQVMQGYLAVLKKLPRAGLSKELEENVFMLKELEMCHSEHFLTINLTLEC